ncbi:MAG: CBS domain-containing protein [Candidatus Saccharibacteria bacterium]
MFIFLFIVTLIVFSLLLLVAAVRPRRESLSLFELSRRADGGDESARNSLVRQRALADVASLQKVLAALLLVVLVLLTNITFGWLWGIIIVLFVALEYGAMARLNIVKKVARILYDKIDGKLIKLIQKFPFIFRILRSVPPDTDDNQRIDSRQELQQLVDESENVLSTDEKNLIIHSLSFPDKLVSEIMTPRSVIDSIRQNEFLGPMTLDELHKTGHSRLPVTNGDIDHIVGMLHLRGLLTLDIKKSTTAEKAMDSKVYYIRGDQTLQHALAAFLRTRHHLFVVVNEFRETIGLLSLEDVIEALLGRKIVDEFDAHDDLRAVAIRNPRGNNHPEKREDV